MNLKSILSDLPTFGMKQGKSFIKPEKVQEIAKEALKKGIAKRSPKRAKEEREYNKEVKIWLVGKMCAVFPNRKATQCHHKRGRIGKLLLDKRYWLPVSDEGHRKIENNPDWARENGFIETRIKDKKV